ncbi:MAG TPA: proteasome subunit beta [Candidatus Nanoarchaeia archaeon]|nr:proteasome subunit beta [Candidatus Nanoarchaeia archaeon]
MDIKKGTTTVGIACKDGIVLAADRRATAGTLIVDKKAQKIYTFEDNFAVTIAGGVSDAQLMVKLLRAETKLKSLRTGRTPTIKETANMLGGLLYSSIRQFSAIPAIAHFLLGGLDQDGMHLYDLYPDGSVTRVDDYTSSGSGSVIAYGVLESQYQKDIAVDDAVKLAIRSVNSAMQRDSATGNGIDVVKITRNGVERVFGQEIKAQVEIR